jgi:hypothetical protein
MYTDSACREMYFATADTNFVLAISAFCLLRDSCKPFTQNVTGVGGCELWALCHLRPLVNMRNIMLCLVLVMLLASLASVTADDVSSLKVQHLHGFLQAAGQTRILGSH